MAVKVLPGKRQFTIVVPWPLKVNLFKNFTKRLDVRFTKCFTLVFHIQTVIKIAKDPNFSFGIKNSIIFGI